MAKIDVRRSDTDRYAQVHAEQKALEKIYSTSAKLARLCPYCGHKIEVLCRGPHSASYVRCSNCGEDVFFPPVSFRRA